MALKLNLGAGLKHIDGFLNIDDDINVKPHFAIDINHGILPFDDNSVDEIVASHILEHIENFVPLMREIYRVCQPNAIIHVTVPHPRSDWYLDDPTHVRSLTVNSFKLFSKKYLQTHIESYGSSNGMAFKYDVDFEIIDVKMRPFPKWEQRFKEMTNEEIQEVADNFNNVFYEISVTLVVVKD